MLSEVEITRAVSEQLQVPVPAIYGTEHHPSIIKARHIAMWMCRQELNWSYPEIARAFGRRDHSTARSAVLKIDRIMPNDADLRHEVEVIRSRVVSNNIERDSACLRIAKVG